MQLTDAIDRLMQEGKPVQAFRMNGRTFDCGNIDGWLKANSLLAREAGYDVRMLLNPEAASAALRGAPHCSTQPSFLQALHWQIKMLWTVEYVQ
ncbi:hypothetical protein HSBAA_20820 [Vreelandella sulfidaeris]|uniref:Uncharacterized protein n=1 Tax=Vreelandella sulfidaeris TaxID=115553 RepID=A0A455U414_9GAMM|nr:hypothetical protein HSBAA_20820 [Halomonas sulfidaeris]